MKKQISLIVLIAIITTIVISTYSFSQEIDNYIDSIIEKKNEGDFELDYMKNQRLNLTFKNKILSFIKSGWLDFIKECWFQFRKNIKKKYYQINPYKYGFYTRSKINNDLLKLIL